MMHTFSNSAAGVLAAAFVGATALCTPVQAQSEATAEATAEASAAAAFSSETVVAVVNGTEITLGHVAQLFDRLPSQYRNADPALLYQGLLDQAIDQQLLAEQQGGDTLPRSVALALDNERRGLLAQISVNAITGADITEAEYQEAYDARFPETEFNASHILVETEEEANALVSELEGGADFAELAKEKSTGPSGPEGGALGWFGQGQMVPAFEAAVAEMEPETISAPVQTRFGWHVIRLNEVREKEPPALDDVKAELAPMIQRKRLEDRVVELRQGADVEVPEVAIPAAAIRDRALLED